MGTLIRFFFGLFFVLLSWFLVALTDFNAGTVFLNPGLGSQGPYITNLQEWLVYARSHSEEFAVILNPFETIDSFTSLLKLLASLFMLISPAFAILICWKVRKLQYSLLILFSLIAIVDFNEFLSFPGYNSGNGGYDGATLILSRIFLVFFSIVIGTWGLVISALNMFRKNKMRHLQSSTKPQ